MTVLWRVIMIVTCWNIFHLKNGNLTWTSLSYQKVSCRLDPVVHDAIISILQNSFKAHLFLPSLFPFFHCFVLSVKTLQSHSPSLLLDNKRLPVML